MTNYQNMVIHLAGDKQKGEVQLVVNLFQSVLDGFIRGEMKKEEAEPAKVRRWSCAVSILSMRISWNSHNVCFPARQSEKEEEVER